MAVLCGISYLDHGLAARKSRLVVVFKQVLGSLLCHHVKGVSHLFLLCII